MRISDWSSDVCSSDLSLLLAGLLAGWALYTLRRSPHGAALKAVAADPAPRWSRVQWIALLLTGGVFMLWSGQYLARSEEHTSELQSLMRISYAVFCLKKKKPDDRTALHNSRINEHDQRHHLPQT